jgi:hypothetical protein
MISPLLLLPFPPEKHLSEIEIHTWRPLCGVVRLIAKGLGFFVFFRVQHTGVGVDMATRRSKDAGAPVPYLEFRGQLSNGWLSVRSSVISYPFETDLHLPSWKITGVGTN